MSKAKNQTVGFLNFFKLNFLYGLALGLLVGIAFLVAAICGWPVNLNLGSWNIHGVPAGIGALVLCPPIFGVIFFVAAPALFLPFTLASHLFGGFKASR